VKKKKKNWSQISGHIENRKSKLEATEFSVELVRPVQFQSAKDGTFGGASKFSVAISFQTFYDLRVLVEKYHQNAIF